MWLDPKPIFPVITLPDPPVEKPQKRQAPKKSRFLAEWIEVECVCGCGKKFETNDSNRKYFSPSCREREYYRRKRAKALQNSSEKCGYERCQRPVAKGKMYCCILHAHKQRYLEYITFPSSIITDHGSST